MVDEARARRVADRIKTVTAANLESIVKDPDLGFVTLTDVRVTGDLQHASVFYTVFGDEEQHETTARLLEKNKGKLRSFVGRQLGIRLTPSLEFIADAVPENAAHVEDLLKQARERDAEVARSGAGEAVRRRGRPLPPRAGGRRPGRGRGGGRGPGCRRTLTDRTRARPPRTACSSSTSPATGPATTSWPGPGGCAPPARSATPGRWTRWPPASSSSASAGARSCSPSSSGPTRSTPPPCASGRPRSPTTQRGR